MVLKAFAGAKVLIYKGSVRSISDVTTDFPKKLTFFDVIDPETGTIGSVIAVSVAGQKAVNVSPPAPVGLASAPLPRGRTATIVSLVTTNGGTGGSFSNIAIHRRGTNTTLTINSQLIGNTFVFPQVFASTAFQAEATDGNGNFIEQKSTLFFQRDRTIAANDANQTTEQVMNTIVAELKAKGFQTP